ncbi:MAG: prephenate dehydrogenase [Thermodesulfobacteriota bacterium]|nr:MAG: prephenate dehydrogenase [Thermodesulfobacteriota bacterium]
MKFNKITIVGLGLIGGSLARALKESNQVGVVVGIDTDEETIKYAFDNEIIDEGASSLNEVIYDSEIIIIATYVGMIEDTAKAVFEIATDQAIITDVGSVKLSVVSEIEADLPDNLHFVGGHPIAGTENSGVRSIDPKLFKDRRCILTPTQKTDLTAKNKVKSMWELVGSQVYEMDSETHDHIFGIVSHLPHVVAYSLMNTVLNAEDADQLLDFAGGGLKDYTRVAASSPQMWTEIFKANKDQMLKAISEFKGSLENIEAAIENDDFETLKEILEKAAKTKRSL